MPKVNIIGWDGKTDSQLDLNKEIFALKIDKILLHSVVTWQRAKKRRGTHSVKTRSEVRGEEKNPFVKRERGMPVRDPFGLLFRKGVA